jgi:hypothetical protein
MDATIDTLNGKMVVTLAWNARDIGARVRRIWLDYVEQWRGDTVSTRVAFLDATMAIVIVKRSRKPGAVAVIVRPCGSSLSDDRASFARGMEG